MSKLIIVLMFIMGIFILSAAESGGLQILGFVFIITRIYLIIHRIKKKKREAVTSIERLTHEKILNIMPAKHSNDTKYGYLAVTQNNIVYHSKKSEKYLFPINSITGIGTTTEGTGNFTSIAQQMGYSKRISVTEEKKLIFYMKGYKNGEEFLEYLDCGDLRWPGPLNKFYKTVSEAGNFSSSGSLDKHKVQ